MKRILLIAAAVMVSVTTYAQGTVNFSNIGGQAVRTAAAGANAGALVPATGYMVALYYAPDGVTDDAMFMQVGAGSAFLGNGLFLGGTRTAPVTPPGARANFIVRAWSTGFGAMSYEAALLDARNEAGSSPIVSVVTGNPTTVPPGVPASLVAAGLQGFQLTIVPEPSVFALGALGVGALLLLRRRK